MKRILLLLLVGVLALSMLLTSCNKDPEIDPFATAGTKKTTQAPSTTKEPEEVEIPTNLVAEIEEKNQVLSRLTNKPVVTEIGDTGVEIELTYQAWPTICRGEGDTLYAVSSLRRGHIDPFAATAFYVSHDNGETWSDPKIINNSPIDDRDTGVVYIGGGKMVVSYFTIGANDFKSGGQYSEEWGGCTTAQKSAKLQEWDTYTPSELALFHGSFLLISEDYGETWTKVKAPVSCPHGPSLMQDGRTLIYTGVSTSTLFFFISRDYGKTWSQHATVAMPQLEGLEGYWEPHVIQLKNKSFVAGIRTSIEGRGLGILITTSDDGKNWTPPKLLDSVVGAPPHFLELNNGVILLTFSDRVGPDIGARGRLSYDGGKTWTETDIDLSANTSTRCFDQSYPSSVQLDDGTIITIYYQAAENDPNASVLYTKWRLNEVTED